MAKLSHFAKTRQEGIVPRPLARIGREIVSRSEVEKALEERHPDVPNRFSQQRPIFQRKVGGKVLQSRRKSPLKDLECEPCCDALCTLAVKRQINR